MKPTIRLKFISIVLLVAIPFLIYSIIEHVHSANENKLVLIQRNLAKAGELAREIDDFIETSQNILYSLALHPSIISNDLTACNEIFSRLLPLYPLHLDIIAVDMSGGNIASAMSPERRPGLNYADREWFIKGKSGVSVVTGLNTSKMSELPSFMITVPVFKESGVQSSILAFPVNLYELQEHFLETESVEPNVSISVIDNSGITLIATKDKSAIGKPYRTTSILREIGKSESGSLINTDFSGRRNLYSYATVEATGWKVLLDIPISEIYKEANYDALNHIFLFTVLCGAGTFLSLVYSKRLSNKVEKLIKGFDEISKGNLDYRVEIAGTEELAHAGAAFNKMIEDRRKHQEEIRSLTESLERKVQLRTSELLSSKNELEAFSYAVSHDLHAPVRHILAFTHILLEEHSPELSDECRLHLQRINRAGENMREMITHLLELSRLNRQELARIPINISSLSAAIINDLRAAEPGRNITAVVAEGLAEHADPALFRIVMQNLIDNSWKYTRNCDSAIIEIGATEINEIRCFFVKDNGCGFDMAYAEKLFAPFQRLHSSEEFEGNGIGLATVMRIIQRHGGKLWAESSPGKGAIFYFTL